MDLGIEWTGRKKPTFFYLMIFAMSQSDKRDLL
jgi:hypothetical protein